MTLTGASSTVFSISCPDHGIILDAACGTGKYWPSILQTGRSVRAVDQSAGMLAQASAKYPDVPTRKLGLQELDYEQAFDGIICMDAMENVFPEDWPLVMANFHRALKPAVATSTSRSS